MDYKTEMRQLIDIIKRNSFDNKLEDTIDDLMTLTTAAKDLTDRINTRVKKSLNVDSASLKAPTKSKPSKVKSFPSVAPPSKPKPTPTQNTVTSTATSAKDIADMRSDFVAKQASTAAQSPKGAL